MIASMRSRSPLASDRPGSPAWTEWSFLVHTIRSPTLASVPSAMRTAGPASTMPRWMRSSRMRRDSSRRRSWLAAMSRVSVPSRVSAT